MQQENNRTEKFEPTWESLVNYTVPEWYMDAKFGIFIHWGPYCVPAFGNEWYARNMYVKESKEYKHHLENWGPHTEFGYKDFIPMFKAEKFDAKEWAALFKEAGAKFVVPVAEHHDGFPMYDSELTEWNAAKMGPKQDIVGELAKATRALDMVFGVSTHRAEHWWFFNGGLEYDSDVQDPEYADFYGPPKTGPRHSAEGWKNRDWEPRPDAKFLEDWLARTCELVDKYQPQLVWFDWWIEQIVFQPYVQKFASYYYNRGLEWDKGVAINYKNETYPKETAVFDVERGQLNDVRPYFWQTDTSVSKNSWSYVTEQDYKTSHSIVGDLVDIVSKNGALLLNIGPKPDGTIPEPEQEILRDIGKWLSVNGEAIYDTRPWKTYGEGPTEVLEGGFTDTKREPFTSQDIRFTTKENVMYATLLAWPEDGKATITSFGSDSDIKAEQIAEITMLGANGTLEWSQDAAGLTVQTPTEKPCEHAFTLKIVLD
ncbi:MAG: alpha-L-fucosidase [Chloroflexi bacterium]|nr:MAG: alpha-L-fucosidase [Chloroflexota bacterium]